MSIRILQTPKNLLLDKLNLQGLLKRLAGMCRCGSRPCTCSRLPDGQMNGKQGAPDNPYTFHQPDWYIKSN